MKIHLEIDKKSRCAIKTAPHPATAIVERKRKAMKLSRVELARKADIHPSVVCGLLTGRLAWNYNWVEKIAPALAMTVPKFFALYR